MADEPPAESAFAAALRAADAAKPEAAITKEPVVTEKVTEVKSENRVPDNLFKKETLAKPVESEIDKITEPTFRTEGERTNFKALRDKAKDYETKTRAGETKIAELEAKIKEVEARGGDTEKLSSRLVEMEKKTAEYEELLAKTNIEEHPAFKKQFVEGRAKIVDRAKKLIEEAGGDVVAITTAFNLRGKARFDALREVASELDGFQQGRLGKCIDELSELDETADSKRASAKQAYQEMQENDRQQSERGRQEFTVTARKAFESATKSVGLEVLTKIDGNDWWNKQADEIQENARKFYEGNNSLDTAAQTALKAHAMPVYRNLYLEERKEVETLNSKVAELQKELKGIHSRSSAPLGGKKLGGESAKTARNPFSEAVRTAGEAR